MRIRRATGRTNAYGVKKIQRHSYSTVSGTTQKNSWWDLRAQAMKRDEGYCVPCRNRGLLVKAIDVHHIKPLSKGGINALSNLICLCDDCHTKRHSHMFRARK